MTSPASFLPAGVVPLDRDQIAARIARDIPEGWFVNLGIGVPTLIADHVPGGRDVVFHSENGILGVGSAPPEDRVQPWLVNAGKQHVTLVAGGSYFHHADSFTMIRGGHLDLCVLGAYEVASNGDIANWITLDHGRAPAVGGAMDLAEGARRLWVATDHLTRGGRPKLVARCSYPLTAQRKVRRIYSDLAVIDVTETGFAVSEIVEGLDFDGLQALTGAPLQDVAGMRLHWSPRSPYVRKVMIAAQETGVAPRLETLRTQVDFLSYAEALCPDNPLGKLPTLVLDDGSSLFDSRVICEYLDVQFAPGRLFPGAPAARFAALRDLALGDGLVDTLMMRLIERIKPAPQQSPAIIAANERKSRAVYDRLEADAAALARRPFDIGHVAIGVALSYADFRFAADDWRRGRPALCGWHAGFAARPSVAAVPVVDDSVPAAPPA